MVLLENVKNANQKETRTITKAETALDNAKFDYEIDNNKDILFLISEVRKILKKENLI